MLDYHIISILHAQGASMKMSQSVLADLVHEKHHSCVDHLGTDIQPICRSHKLAWDPHRQFLHSRLLPSDTEQKVFQCIEALTHCHSCPDKHAQMSVGDAKHSASESLWKESIKVLEHSVLKLRFAMTNWRKNSCIVQESTLNLGLRAYPEDARHQRQSPLEMILIEVCRDDNFDVC